MKFKVTFKSPDGVSDSINDAVKNALRAHQSEYADSPDEDLEGVENDIRETLEKFISNWVSGSEYITVEFNTDIGTCMVVPKLRS